MFGDAKPTCANCVVRCYRADMREQIRVVMRWAGPRMMLRHPIMGIAHLIDERRPVPKLPTKSAKSSAATQDVANSSGSEVPRGEGQDSTEYVR